LLAWIFENLLVFVCGSFFGGDLRFFWFGVADPVGRCGGKSFGNVSGEEWRWRGFVVVEERFWSGRSGVVVVECVELCWEGEEVVWSVEVVVEVCIGLRIKGEGNMRVFQEER
jgi:hypothetical protein